MLSLRDLRKTLKRETAVSKRNGDTLPDARARKMTRYVSGMVIETLEIPMSEDEQQAQVEGILARGGTRVESSQKSSHIQEQAFFAEFNLGSPFMNQESSEAIDGGDECPEPLPEPVPVSD